MAKLIQAPKPAFKQNSNRRLTKPLPKVGYGERETLVLEAPRNGSPRRFYFESGSGLLLRVEDWNAAGKMIEAAVYRDYREVDGVKVPFLINIIEDVVFTMKLSEVKQNVAIDDAVFVKPKK